MPNSCAAGGADAALVIRLTVFRAGILVLVGLHVARDQHLPLKIHGVTEFGKIKADERLKVLEGTPSVPESVVQRYRYAGTCVLNAIEPASRIVRTK